MVKAIRIDFINLLKIASTGLHALIKYRNNYEYNNKETVTTNFNAETHPYQKQIAIGSVKLHLLKWTRLK